MVTELRSLLHGAADEPVGDQVDTDQILALARRRVTHRRRTVIAGATFATAAVLTTAGIITQSQLDTRTDQDRNVAAPEYSRELARAQSAVQDRDYDLLTTLPQPDLWTEDGRLIEAITPEGVLVYRDGPVGGSSATEIGLLDPVTGEATALPAETAEIGADRINTTHHWIAGVTRGVPSQDIWLYARGTGGVTTYTLDEVADAAGLTELDMSTASITRIQFGPPRQLYLSLGTNTLGDPRTTIVAISLDGVESGTLVAESLGEVALWSISERRLSYVEVGDTAGDDVHVLDMRSDDEWVVRSPSEGDCVKAQLYSKADRLIVREQCETSSDDLYSQLRTFTYEGEPIDNLQDRSFVVLASTSHYMVLGSKAPAGTFLYDVRDQSLLRLSETEAPFDDSSAGEVDRIVWGTPINDGSGLKTWVADFG